MVWPYVITIPHSLLDCADEVIEYQEETAPARGRGTEAVWGLVGNHRMAAASVAADHIQERRAFNPHKARPHLVRYGIMRLV